MNRFPSVYMNSPDSVCLSSFSCLINLASIFPEIPGWTLRLFLILCTEFYTSRGAIISKRHIFLACGPLLSTFRPENYRLDNFDQYFCDLIRSMNHLNDSTSLFLGFDSITSDIRIIFYSGKTMSRFSEMWNDTLIMQYASSWFSHRLRYSSKKSYTFGIMIIASNLLSSGTPHILAIVLNLRMHRSKSSSCFPSYLFSRSNDNTSPCIPIVLFLTSSTPPLLPLSHIL